MLQASQEKKLRPKLRNALRQWAGEEDLEKRLVAIVPEGNGFQVVLIPHQVFSGIDFVGDTLPEERDELEFGVAMTRTGVATNVYVSNIRGEDSNDVALCGIRSAVKDYLTSHKGNYHRAAHVVH